MPHGGVAQDTVQATPLFAASLATVATNCVVAPACTVAVPGVTKTVIAGTVTVTTAAADFDESATAVAVIVTVKPAVGALLGAV